MGTRADFYVGRGEDAEWLGSIAWDGYPDGIDRAITHAESEGDYRLALAAFAKTRDDWTAPERGWPWPWQTSHTTDFAYAFDGGKVFASCFGGQWRGDPLEDDFEGEEDERRAQAGEPVPVFPDMAGRRNVAWGERSGLIVISAPVDPPEPS